MATRKPRGAKRSARPVRAPRKKTPSRKARPAARAERRRLNPETLRLRSIEPSFTVSDLDASVRFYTENLGFIVAEQWNDSAVRRGATLRAGVCELNLTQDDWAKGRDRRKGDGLRLWCQTAQDIDVLAARIKAAGGRLTEEPADRPWGGRSLSLDDPDGFHLTIYHERES